MCIELIQERGLIHFQVQEFRVALWCSASALAQTQCQEGMQNRNIYDGEMQNKGFNGLSQKWPLHLS